MSRICTVSATLLMLAAAGCGPSAPDFSPSAARIGVSPTILVFGDVGVGETEVRTVQLDALVGNQITIDALELIQDPESAFFRVDAPWPLVLERGQSQLVDIVYTPQAAGDHAATLVVGSDTRESILDVDMRAAAWEVDVSVFPPDLEFGALDPGETAVRSLTVRNDAEIDLVVESAETTHAGFTLSQTLPLTVPAGGQQVLTVVFEPYAFGPVGGSLWLRSNLGDLPVITVAGNDCLLGDPNAFDRDGDGVSECGGDCDDRRADVHPGAVEVVDGVDQDCNGLVDDGTPAFDDDGDGWCEAGCTDGSVPGDCHDGFADVFPGAVEDPTNGRDDDCDGIVDIAMDLDADGDGFTLEGGDCDPDDPDTFPGAPELADDRDNSCDGVIDEGTAGVDDDGDGWCEHPFACTDGSVPGDCDDTAYGVHPHGLELPDWRDNDCDGDIDEGTVNVDDDADGFSEVQGDCDDGDASRSPRLGNC